MASKTLKIACLTAFLFFNYGLVPTREKAVHFPVESGLKSLPYGIIPCRTKVIIEKSISESISTIEEEVCEYSWELVRGGKPSREYLKKYGLENENPEKYYNYYKGAQNQNKNKE